MGKSGLKASSSKEPEDPMAANEEVERQRTAAKKGESSETKSLKFFLARFPACCPVHLEGSTFPPHAALAWVGPAI